ncbi:MAG TPA: M48 family metallopeptidase [Steroidobacteraceae bacterium]|nr:M48 family metallopeptidase [Steroidobacteraceae bacterium]
MRAWGFRATLLMVSGLVACATVQTTNPGAVGIDRRQQMLVSEEDVEKAAVQAYAQEVGKARTDGKLNSDPELTARVRRVAGRLIPTTGAFRADAPKWNWEINTLTTDELNAYAMPGGKIMVYSGLVEKLKLTDAELAAVVGHEISHALREHTRERVSRAYAQQIALTGIAIFTGAGEGAMDLAGQVASMTFQLPHSREQESEADVMGLELMARAGYDPHAAVKVWQKMMAAEKSSQPQFLSTHPSPGNRIEELEARMPKVMPLYLAARKA